MHKATMSGKPLVTRLGLVRQLLALGPSVARTRLLPESLVECSALGRAYRESPAPFWPRLVRIEPKGKDRYDRTLGRVFVSAPIRSPIEDGLKSVHVNLVLVAHGMAWYYKQHSDDVSLAQAEQDARDANPIPPWDWGSVPDVSSNKVHGND
jgi:hypothetical protein